MPQVNPRSTLNRLEPIDRRDLSIRVFDPVNPTPSSAVLVPEPILNSGSSTMSIHFSHQFPHYLPTIRGTIERRLLLNYRVDPAVAAGLLPPPFRPLLHEGHAIAGVCLIRLAHLRPNWLPGNFGLRFENAAVRIAAEWDTPLGIQSGVFVLSRYTSSRLAALAGGRVFPGVHRRVTIASQESQTKVAVNVQARRGFAIHVRGESTNDWPADSIFPSPAAASTFFAAGSLGYSWHPDRREFECLELCVPDWHAAPFAVHDLAATYFDDRRRFPRGSIAFDHALVMRDIQHEWRLREPIAGSIAGSIANPIADTTTRAVHSPRADAVPTPIQV